MNTDDCSTKLVNPEVVQRRLGCKLRLAGNHTYFPPSPRIYVVMGTHAKRAQAPAERGGWGGEEEKRVGGTAAEPGASGG